LLVYMGSPLLRRLATVVVFAIAVGVAAQPRLAASLALAHDNEPARLAPPPAVLLTALAEGPRTLDTERDDRVAALRVPFAHSTRLATPSRARAVVSGQAPARAILSFAPKTSPPIEERD
jgi:hypothetical protein